MGERLRLSLYRDKTAKPTTYRVFRRGKCVAVIRSARKGYGWKAEGEIVDRMPFDSYPRRGEILRSIRTALATPRVLMVGLHRTGQWTYNENLETWDLVWATEHRLAAVVDVATGSAWASFPFDGVMTKFVSGHTVDDSILLAEAWLRGKGATGMTDKSATIRAERGRTNR